MVQKPNKKDILDLSRDELISWLEAREMAPYRAEQILKWVYLHQADTFDVMTNVSKQMRALLSQQFTIDRLHKVRLETSKDGSQKYLFRLKDGKHMESVLIPERDHYTLCVSSQVGCAQGCQFCLTATGGFERNLAAGEIVAQVRDIQNDLNDTRYLRNIVFMGMGEPLANYHNLLRALKIITDNDYGLRFASRRVTVSTAGLVPKLPALGRDTNVNLAVSLNATDNETRNRLMPINRKYPIERLLEACRDYRVAPGRMITFEYILIKGINDSPDDARRLVKLLRPLRAKINLIPFNAHAGCDYDRPDEVVINRFQEILIQKNYTVMVRQSKGQDISAACGQLRAKSAVF